MRSCARRSLRQGLLILALAGCATAPKEPTKEYVPVNVAVSAGCVVNKPEPVTPLNERIPQEVWDTRAPGAKFQSFKAQAGERMNYEDDLRAAVKACPAAELTKNPIKLVGGAPA